MNTGFEARYGQFIVDFANAKDTENALLACFVNLQRNFQFPSDFYETATNLFPSINVISVLLSNNDKKLLEQILKKNDVIKTLNEQLKPIKYTIENYDPLSRTVSLMSLKWNRENSGDQCGEDQSALNSWNSGGFLQTLKLLGLSIVDGPITIQIDAISAEIETLLGSQAADQFNQLMKIGFVIEELTSELDARKYQELNLLAQEHWEVIDFHNKMKEVQTDCRQILDMEIEGKPFNEIPAFAKYLDIYNKTGGHRLIITENNHLTTEFPINERKYLTIKVVAGWLDVLQSDTAYCLIEMLKSTKGRKRLKKCRTCSKYFIARQPHIQKFCTRQCRMDQPRSV